VFALKNRNAVYLRKNKVKELTGRILNSLCWSSFALNKIEDALEDLAEAKTIWRELGNLQQLAEASKTMLLIYDAIGDYRRVLTDAPELAKLSVSIGDRLGEGNALLTTTFAYARQGRFEQALANIEKVRAYIESIDHPNEKHTHQWARIKFYLTVCALQEAERWADELSAQRETIPPNFMPIYLTEAALAKIACGKLDEGQAILDEMLAGLVPNAPWSYAIIPIAVGYGQLCLAVGQPESLFAGLEERIQPFRKASYFRLLADEYWLHGRANLALEQFDAAREALLKAKEAAEAQEERAILWKILVTMGEVERATGDEAAAVRLRDQARVVVEDIAAHAGELRDIFLSQPTVVQLLCKN
jgi:tetratricopeptide (TPR) repeat protein